MGCFASKGQEEKKNASPPPGERKQAKEYKGKTGPTPPTQEDLEREFMGGHYSYNLHDDYKYSEDVKYGHGRSSDV